MEKLENPLSLKGTIFENISDYINMPTSSDFLQNVFIPFLLLFTIFYMIISGILFYHWETYGMKNKNIILANVIFFTVSLVLFIFAFTIAFNL